MATYSARLTPAELMNFRALFDGLSSSDTTEIAITPNDGTGDGKIAITLTAEGSGEKDLDASFSEGLLSAYKWDKRFKKSNKENGV